MFSPVEAYDRVLLLRVQHKRVIERVPVQSAAFVIFVTRQIHDLWRLVAETDENIAHVLEAWIVDDRDQADPIFVILVFQLN